MQPQNPEVTRRMEKAKKYLRFFLLDTPLLNRLINGQESTDELLEFAIDMAISDWNSSAPVLGIVRIGNYPSLYLLMHGAVIQIMKSQGILQARNEATFNAGGSSFMRSNKTQHYNMWMTNFSNEYENKKRQLKIQQNIAGGWGGVASEYDKLGYSW